ncbi:MAG TPA: BTAD domain-containing putative transcriptional regulator, partial [Candidatus Lustribacter sp.]|nr:BTAD domain-containing putative transcriptional regulator [Candidatus Lustribacter sp.]
LHDVARHRGLVWLRRLAYVVALCRTAQPRRCAEARALAVERRRVGDEWGAALIESSVAFALLRRGRPDIELLEELTGRFRLLGSPQLEAWARSAHALAAAEADLPDFGPPESAGAFARAAGAPGALALAYAALAASRPDQGAELLRLAESTARESGLGCRPWTWKRDAASPSSPATAVWGPLQQATVTGHLDGAATTSASARHTPLVWSGLTLTCFGEFSVTAHGRSVDLAGVRPVALTVLRILAAHAGTPVHREVIVDALWGELRETAALHNLHVAVSSLRQGLESVVPGRSRQLLARQGQAYVLAPGTERITDLQRLDAHLAAATRCRHAGDPTGQIQALREAIDVYVGVVLPGDGAAEWVLAIRDRYRQAAAGAAARLAELELGRECAAAAAAAAHRSLQIDPWRDASWHALILAHDRAGEPAEAERARQEYAAMLDSLGVRTMARPPARPAAVTPSATATAARPAQRPPVRTA